MFLDTYAWLEYLAGSPAGEKVRQILDETPVVHTSPIVLAEVYSKLLRTVGAHDAEEVIQHILDRSAVTDADESIGLAAGAIHAEQKPSQPTFGMADAFVLATARSRGVKVVTGDSHFRAFDDVVMI